MMLKEILETVEQLNSESNDRHWKINEITDKLESIQNLFITLKQRLAILQSSSYKMKLLEYNLKTCEKHSSDTECKLDEIQTCLDDLKETLDNVEEFTHPCGGGGWRHVVDFDMTRNGTICPVGGWVPLQ